MIEAIDLGRYFGPIKAVDGVSFTVEKGEVLGFLGPNGAGKSTTMKMLTCFLTPSFGRATVGGACILEESQKVRSLLGYLPENAPLYGEMEVEDFLRFISEVRKAADAPKLLPVEEILEKTSLKEVRYQRIETLSKGYRRRVGLAQSLLHDPEILILDEPTDGLDPNQKHEVRTLISEMAEEKCIILSTHILEEVDEVCTRAVIIAGGKIVADDTPEELKKRSRVHGAVTVTLQKPVPEDLSAGLRQIPGVKEVEETSLGGNRVRYTLFPSDSETAVSAFVREARQAGWNYSALTVEDGRLDEVFREITNQ